MNVRTKLCRLSRLLAGCLPLVCLPWASAADAPIPDALARWGQADTSFAQNKALFARLENASAEAYAAYFAQAQNLTDPRSASACDQIVAYWANRAPQDALQGCLALPTSPEQGNYVRALFREWARANIPEALAALQKCGEKTPLRVFMERGFIEGYAQKNAAEAFAFLAEQKGGDARYFAQTPALMTEVFREWAGQDPKAAWKPFLAYMRLDTPGFSYEPFTARWFAEDPTAFLDAVKDVSGYPQFLLMCGPARDASFENVSILFPFFDEYFEGAYLSALYDKAFFKLSGEDPRKAFALMEPLSGQDAKKAAAQALFNRWSKSDFDSALACANTLADGNVREIAVKSCWRALAKYRNFSDMKPLLQITDPVIRQTVWRDAMNFYLPQGGNIDDLMKQVPDEATRKELLLSLPRARFTAWNDKGIPNRTSARALRDWAMTLPPSEARTNLLSFALAGDFNKEDLLWMAGHLPNAESAKILKNLGFESGSSLGGVLNAETLPQLPEGKLKDRFLLELSVSWTQTQPGEARKWLATLPASAVRDQAYREHVEALIKGGQMEAAVLSIQTPPPGYAGEADYFYGDIAYRLARKNPTEALQWAFSLKGDVARKTAIESVGHAWSKKQALEFFKQMEAFSDRPERDDAVISFVGRWMLECPDAAGVWLRERAVSQNKLVRAVVKDSFKQWIWSDSTAARAWAMSLPQGAVKAIAADILVDSDELSKNPEGVMTVVLSLPQTKKGENARIELLIRMAQRLAGGDPQKLKMLVEHPGLTESERVAVRNAAYPGQ